MPQLDDCTCDAIIMALDCVQHVSNRQVHSRPHLHVLSLPCLDLPSHIMLLSSRGFSKEVVKGPLLLAEVEDLPQRAVAHVWQGHYKQPRDLAL